MNKKRHIYFIIGIILCIHSSIVFIVEGSVNFGSVLPFIGGLFLICIYILNKKEIFISNNLFNFGKKIIKIFFIMWLISFLIITSFIIKEANDDEIKEIDFIIILGGGIKKNEPSKTLKKRLELGEHYSKKFPKSNIYVSGGKGIGEDITEAEAMKKYLTDNGVNRKRIFEEGRATSTFENLKFTKELLKEDRKDYKKVLIITSDFHMLRSKFIARRIGFKAYGKCSNVPFYLYPNMFLREYLALIKTYIFDRV
ncbi:MAG: YdcF family protein [Clostridiales bacterium]